MTPPQLDAALRGALIVLTGPTSGLGLAVYDILRAHAVPLVALGRRIDRLVAGDGASVRVEADLTDALPAPWIDEVKAGTRRLLEAHPDRTLVFLNNAGTITPIGPAAALDDQALHQAMQVNVAAPFALAKAMVEVAQAVEQPLRIVNVSTGAAMRAIPGWLAYCTSKAACRMAFDVLAAETPWLELVHVDPGVIDTGMQAYIRQQSDAPGAAAPAQLKSPEQAAQEVLAKALGTVP